MALTPLVVLAVLGVLALLTLGLVLFVLRVGKHRATEQKLAPPPPAVPHAERDRALQQSFRSTMGLIERNLAPRRDRYDVPWVLLLGEAGSGKSTLVRECGIPAALRPAGGPAGHHAGVEWHFFDRGVVIDVKGERLEASEDGRESERGWRTLLRLAQRYRPQRPIDSVIVTVGADALVDARPGSLEALGRRGEMIHRRLWEAQARFGIRFPVYLVITQCDRLEGFTSFAKALPDSMRRSILGWSVPYDLEAVFQDAWVDQAIAAIRQTISGTQDELLAAGRVPDHRDAFVQLPTQAAAMREGLREFLEQMIRPSAFHEAFFFRGIYLSGDGGLAAHEMARLAFLERPSAYEPSEGEGAPGAAGARHPAPPVKPIFVRDLFEQKIFAEHGLARPVSEQRGARGRVVTVLKWAAASLALVWSAGLVYSGIALDRKVEQLERAVHQTQLTVAERRAAHARKEHLPLDWYRQRSTTLLNRMVEARDTSLWSVFIPASWPLFQDLEDEVQYSFDEAFSDILLNTARKSINERVHQLTEWRRDATTTELDKHSDCTAPRTRAADAAPATAGRLAIEDTDEFRALAGYVDRVLTLDSVIDTYKRMRESGGQNVADFRALVQHTFAVDLPVDFGTHSTLFRVALRRASRDPKLKLGYERIETAIRCSAAKGVEQLYARFFERNDVLEGGERVRAMLPAVIEQDAPDAGEAPLASDVVERLRDELRALDAVLRDPRTAWLHKGQLELGAPFEQLLARFSETSLLGEGARESARGGARAAVDRLVARLGNFSTAEFALLRRNPETQRWQLTPDAVALETGLNALLGQRFMTGFRDRSLAAGKIEAGRTLWDLKLLDQGIDLGEVRRRYLAEGLAKLPGAAQDRIRGLVDRQLVRRVVDYVVDSQSAPFAQAAAGAGPAAAQETLNFEAARPRLLKVLALLSEVGADVEYQQLLEIAGGDAQARLRAVNDSLEHGQFYAVREGGFSWWQGAKNPALDAFAVPDAQALGAHLGQQISRIETLGKLSEPLVALLEGAGTGRAGNAASLVRRWRAINAEIERHKAKNPNSSIAALEGFVLTRMQEIDQSNCLDKLDVRGPALAAADYFTQRRTLLQRQLAARCHEIKAREAKDAYKTIEARFNRTLAGRFPFAPAPEDAPGAEPEVDEIVDFLQLYARHAKVAQALADRRLPGYAQAEPARRFLDQVDRARGFLAPLAPGEDGAPGAGYDVWIDFRVNERAEIDGNKILDWAVQIGEQSVRHRDTTRQLRWRVGLPVTLTLRWAKDAHSAPMNEDWQRHLGVQDGVVVFRYADPWALFSFLSGHKASSVDAVTPLEQRPHLLKFEFPVRRAAPSIVAGDAAATGRARVFLRVVVSPAGKKQVLTLPFFPERAPRLDGGTTLRNGGSPGG